jgi:hydrogenase large subunit
MKVFYNQLIANIKAGDSNTANMTKFKPDTWPKSCKGVGTGEAPRGALGHWVQIEDMKIKNYQCIVPTTWNASPRDNEGNIGAFEAALLDTPMADPEQPLEILRTIHSFDPCLACATHVYDANGVELTKVEVR